MVYHNHLMYISSPLKVTKIVVWKSSMTRFPEPVGSPAIKSTGEPISQYRSLKSIRGMQCTGFKLAQQRSSWSTIYIAMINGT